MMATKRPPFKYVLTMQRQLDEKLAAFRSLPAPARPQQGWVHTLRNGLMMSARTLADRIGISESGLRKLERSEASDTISLGTLRKVAAAMDCELHYVLLPKSSLKGITEARAMAVAREIVLPVSHSMALSGKIVDPARTEEQIRDLAQEILAKGDKALW